MRNGSDLAVSEAVSRGIVVDNRRAGFKGAEAHEAVDKGLEIGDVDDNNGSGGFADVPVQIEEIFEAISKVVVTIKDCAKDLMRFENQLPCTYRKGKRNLRQEYLN